MFFLWSSTTNIWSPSPRDTKSYMTRCIKYWIRIIQLYNHARYPKCYDILYQLDIACRHTWATDVTNMLYRFGLSKLDTYCTFKSLLEPERYLYCTNIYVHRKALAKLRCSNHNLAIDKLRGTIDRGGRHCKHCLNLNNTYVVENKYHFIMFCTNRSCASFKLLMSSKWEILLQNLCNFTFYAFKWLVRVRWFYLNVVFCVVPWAYGLLCFMKYKRLLSFLWARTAR